MNSIQRINIQHKVVGPDCRAIRPSCIRTSVDSNPVDKKLISNAYCIGNVVGFYNSNELSILLSTPYLIRDEDDELPSSACSGPEAIFPELSSYSMSAIPLTKRKGGVGWSKIIS